LVERVALGLEERDDKPLESEGFGFVMAKGKGEERIRLLYERWTFFSCICVLHPHRRKEQQLSSE
jgi:hypothetical protein